MLLDLRAGSAMSVEGRGKEGKPPKPRAKVGETLLRGPSDQVNLEVSTSPVRPKAKRKSSMTWGGDAIASAQRSTRRHEQTHLPARARLAHKPRVGGV